MRKLPSAVILLGTVSLLNDMASDMIMPLLPVFLTATLGAGPAILGLIEGVAESTASLLKLWAGRLGDGGVGHKPLAVTGYALSNLVRPLLSVAGSWGVVMAVCFADRAGKGLRTSPRDALVSGSVNADQRGQAFGLHRAMDRTGAFIGPLLASGLLAYGLTMQQVFLASVVPGVLAVALLMFGLRVAHAAERRVTPPPLQWSLLHPRLRALVALPTGHWSDRFGRVPVVLVGWSVRALLLIGLPFVSHPAAVITLFFLYAASTAATEGAERAVIGDFAGKGAQGTAFGLYNMMVGLFALPGALWFGAVWEFFGMTMAFVISGALMVCVAFTLCLLTRKPI